MNPEVFIRVDGDSRIGLGHLIRCMALAFMLKDDFEVTFFCEKIPTNYITQLSYNNFKLRKIDTETEFFNEVKNTSIIVLDGYKFDYNYQLEVKNKGAILVCLDDLHNIEFIADLIINHSPDITGEKYNTLTQTIYALGSKYVLLRPSFLEIAKENREIASYDSIMICFGGSDVNNLTESTLLEVLKFTQFKRIIVITGDSHKESVYFKQLIVSDSRITHKHAISENEMLQQMLLTPISIVPASGILLESLAAGCITISGMSAENQKFLYDNYKKRNLIIDAVDFSSSKLNLAIKKSFDFPTIIKPFDGKSGERLLKLFKQIRNLELIKIRLARITDLEIAYKWVKDPDVRKYSFNKDQITLNKHTQWFTNKIRDPNCCYYFAEVKEKQIGSIRFDINQGEAIISYLVDPIFHGKGYGLVLMVKGIEEFIKALNNNQNNKVKTISGFVMQENKASLNAFNKLGFKQLHYDNHYKFEKKIT